VTSTLGEQFVAAIAARDTDGLRAVLDPGLDFRALTPGKFWEASSAEVVVDEIVFGPWFEPTDRITGVSRIETDDVGPRHRVGYRLAVTNGDGDHMVDQQAYYETDGERITWLRIMCAGFLPVG
jgi:hypothetical protein